MRAPKSFGSVSSFLIASVIAALLLTGMPIFGSGGAAALIDGSPSITGTVVDGNGDPISGAKVILETAMFVLTDEEGRFNISAAPGNHTLTITYSGAATKTVIVVLGSESEDVGTIELLPQPVDDMLVYASIVLALVVAGIMLFYIYWGGKKQDEEERKAKEKK